MSRPRRVAELAGIRVWPWLGLALASGIACSDDNGPTPQPPANLVRACIRATTCGYQPYPRVADCLRGRPMAAGLTALTSDCYACADRASSCDALAACFGAQGECDNTFQARCESGAAVLCDLIDRRVYSYRCSTRGLTCQLDPQFKWAATCVGQPAGGQAIDLGLDGLDSIITRTGQGCGQTDTPSDRCAGEQLEACLDGEWIRFDCAGMGLGACRMQGDNPAIRWGRCSPPG